MRCPSRLLFGPRAFLSTLLLTLLLAACGGGAGSSASTASVTPVAAPPMDSNATAVVVEAGPGNNVNIPYVTVTVCVPGSSVCKTIDHVLLDTGSTGLRLFASQVQAEPALPLPAHTINGSAQISECAQFLNNVAWGPVKLADVSVGGENASSVPIQLMDANFAPLPPVCGSSPLLSTATAGNTKMLQANGILGVSLFTHDGQIYFNCVSPGASCQINPGPSQQVQNPVSLFKSGNNNGVVVQLPALPEAGVSRALGFLIFGVGTRANNQLGAATVVPVNASGFFTTLYKGNALPVSFMDSGSNGLYFKDTSLSSNCALAPEGFYCQPDTQSLSANILLAGSSAKIDFSITNADTLLASGSHYAFANLGGSLSANSFDWGLPFFFGRSVYTVMEGKTVGSGASAISGPFNAFVKLTP